MFKEDLLSISFDKVFKEEISHLEETIIYKKLEEKFKPENFDLITWFVVSD